MNGKGVIFKRKQVCSLLKLNIFTMMHLKDLADLIQYLEIYLLILHVKIFLNSRHE